MNVPELSVVIPVYNEKDNLTELIDRCLAACKKTDRGFEIILVDDGSRDGSGDIISQAADRHSQVIAVILNRNYGQHAAVFAGLEQSNGEIVVTLDADLQNPPEEIPNLVREMGRGVDVVGTVRQNRQDTGFRRAGSALINRIVQRATGVMMHDYGCMLRGLPSANCRCHAPVPGTLDLYPHSGQQLCRKHCRNPGQTRSAWQGGIQVQFPETDFAPV